MLRPRLWHMVALGPVVGILSGTLSYWLQYWIDPTIVNRPIGQYGWVVLYNVLAWTSWLLFIPLIWRLASAVRIRRDRFIRPTMFHLAASLVLAALVCVISGFEQYGVMAAAPVAGLQPQARVPVHLRVEGAALLGRRRRPPRNLLCARPGRPGTARSEA